MFKFFFHHQTATAESVVSDPITAREDFTLTDIDHMTVREILNVLRRDTIEFTEAHNLTWAASDFAIHNVPVRVKLTENQDVWYYINGELALDMKEAITLIHDQAMAF